MYTPLVKLLNPKPRNVGNDKNLLTLNGFSDIYALAIQNIKLSKDTQTSLWHILYLNFNVGDKVLDRNRTRDVWNLKYDVAYYVI